MKRKRIDNLEEAKNHFYKSDNPIIFDTSCGSKLCDDYQEVFGYWKNRKNEQIKIDRGQIKKNGE